MKQRADGVIEMESFVPFLDTLCKLDWHVKCFYFVLAANRFLILSGWDQEQLRRVENSEKNPTGGER